jgi:hypothetical protein
LSSSSPEQVKHDPLGLALFARVAWRHLKNLNVSQPGVSHRTREGVFQAAADCRGGLVLGCSVTKEVDQLSVRARHASNQALALQRTAGLIDTVARADACTAGELVVIERLSTEPKRLKYRLLMASQHGSTMPDR